MCNINIIFQFFVKNEKQTIKYLCIFIIKKLNLLNNLGNFN
jgi:hypothetical protein